MKSFRLPVLGALFAALASASPALAQSPAGRWAFETAAVAGNCQLSGEMTIWATREKNKYGCRFIVTQACTGPDMDIKVEQTCTADRAEADISIRSQVEQTVSVSPPQLLEAVKRSYAPDHFDVRLNRAGDEMTGLFHSLSQAAVRFWRIEDLVG